MDSTDLWPLIDAQRAATAEMFASLTPTQWAAPSLCEGWTVRDVGAHLTLQSMSVARTLGVALRHPGPVNRVIDVSSRTTARRLSTEAIVERLRSLVGVHRPNAGPSTTAPVLDLLAGYHDSGRTAVFRNLVLRGTRLVATDIDWS